MEGLDRAYPKTQIALSTLHLVQGLRPSHLLFFNRHRSQALHTRLRIPSAVESCVLVGRLEWAVFEAGDEGTGDMVMEAVCVCKLRVMLGGKQRVGERFSSY